MISGYLRVSRKTSKFGKKLSLLAKSGLGWQKAVFVGKKWHSCGKKKILSKATDGGDGCRQAVAKGEEGRELAGEEPHHQRAMDRVLEGALTALEALQAAHQSAIGAGSPEGRLEPEVAVAGLNAVEDALEDR